jgi:hypothetical protein
MAEWLILIALIVIAEEGARYARRIIKALDRGTDASVELQMTLNACIDEVRGVQTYGLRIQK